ncbi:MAG: tRNA epoxyqueuosine(34) reductase QueG [Planctomycetales bacterium]|nr:tRNA epoxyqueuosine(34) reductase QueG [Planctomycetales bacterium]
MRGIDRVDSGGPVSRPEWIDALRRYSVELGFAKLGIAPAVDSSGFTDLVKWIDAGYSAEMDYFASRLDAYRHPDGVMPGTKSIIVLAYPYPADVSVATRPMHGRVARYAWSGVDYHDTIHDKLKRLRRLIADSAPDVRTRGCVDTAPLMERELAELAGIGWRGKNTLLLNRELGSYFFLACLLVDVIMPYDTHHDASYCGSCTACLDACPTDAFPAAGVLDASRCISYLTIEHRESIPTELREGIGNWVFGCDICQEVCPWNRKPSRRSSTSVDDKPIEQLALTSLFELDDESFRHAFRDSPLWRTRLRGIRRNAAIVLGNQRERSALSALHHGAASDDPMVAEACRWAIDRILGLRP